MLEGGRCGWWASFEINDSAADCNAPGGEYTHLGNYLRPILASFACINVVTDEVANRVVDGDIGEVKAHLLYMDRRHPASSCIGFRTFTYMQRSIHFLRSIGLDDHDSHCTVEFFQYCISNIRPTCLPSHSTHLLQPLDVVLFGPLQKLYSTELDGWHWRGNNAVRKGNFHGYSADLL